MVIGMARYTPAQTSHSKPSFTFERHDLPNGIRVLLRRDERAPIVSLQTWCRGGSAMDPEGKTGMAPSLYPMENWTDELKLWAAALMRRLGWIGPITTSTLRPRP